MIESICLCKLFHVPATEAYATRLLITSRCLCSFFVWFWPSLYFVFLVFSSWAGGKFCRGYSSFVYLLFCFVLCCVGVRWSKASNLVAGRQCPSPATVREEVRCRPATWRHLLWRHSHTQEQQLQWMILAMAEVGQTEDARRTKWKTGCQPKPRKTFGVDRRQLHVHYRTITPSLNTKGTWSIHVTDHDMQSETSDWKEIKEQWTGRNWAKSIETYIS